MERLKALGSLQGEKVVTMYKMGTASQPGKPRAQCLVHQHTEAARGKESGSKPEQRGEKYKLINVAKPLQQTVAARKQTAHHYCSRQLMDGMSPCLEPGSNLVGVDAHAWTFH